MNERNAFIPIKQSLLMQLLNQLNGGGSEII